MRFARLQHVIPLLTKFSAGSSHIACVQQCQGENPNIALMLVGLIAGTPVFPKLAFTIDLLTLFYHLAADSQALAFKASSRLYAPSNRYIHTSQISPITDSHSSNMFSPSSTFFRKHSTTSLMCSAGSKDRWMQRLAVMLLIGA